MILSLDKSTRHAATHAVAGMEPTTTTLSAATGTRKEGVAKGTTDILPLRLKIRKQQRLETQNTIGMFVPITASPSKTAKPVKSSQMRKRESTRLTERAGPVRLGSTRKRKTAKHAALAQFAQLEPLKQSNVQG